MDATMSFNEQPFPFALVPGGWLPLPFVIPSKFLVDRNVVAAFRKLRDRPERQDLQAFQWWTRFFDEGTGTFSPLPYAWEGGFRRTPSFSEFVAAFEEGASELRNALPKVQVISLADEHYRAAHQLVVAMVPRAKREADFLCAACPMIANRVSRRNEAEVAASTTSRK